mmetsp:Transcript_19033/g.36651  ORF Transcript_19033/g.36651 Transcript_19033/m.36651 type:complete len:254 (-) Transcript_19033:541-1302(-)
MGCVMGGRSTGGCCSIRPSGRAVFTQELDMRCKQETDLVIELSRQADDHNVSWAVVESNRQTLDDEMVAEALAWSYEHPSPRDTSFEGRNSACWSPTLLTHRRALLAKLDRGSGAFDQGGIGEEGLRLPVGMRSVCLPGEQTLPRKVSSIRRKHQQATLHTEHRSTHWRSFRATMITKVAAVSRMNRPLVGKDWTPIIGPDGSFHFKMHRLKQQMCEEQITVFNSETGCAYKSTGSAYTEINSICNDETLDRI